ncbi:hypothetical protein PR001_g31447 [Phytophthora rubi]|uniref:Uncharacterized protein n=2 Tax=Phytophthora rubi TaxID=129364 RepID=A0A6A3HAB1_9STRA|nr:hypothetical protein PR001_g31447 [Phytophthora rubi]KAE8965648.1 hypothetical protein PR002_g28621 [Phytophthora rubi]
MAQNGKPQVELPLSRAKRLFANLGKRAKEAAAVVAPPVIKVEAIGYFNDGERDHRVFVRGDRTRAGIFFKEEDVTAVFEVPRLASDAGYRAGVDYQWFLVPDLDTGKHHQEEEPSATDDDSCVKEGCFPVTGIVNHEGYGLDTMYEVQ